MFKRLYNLNIGSVWDLILAREMIEQMCSTCRRVKQQTKINIRRIVKQKALFM